MCYKFFTILVLYQLIIMKPHLLFARKNAESENINAILLKCSEETSRNSHCFPQLIVNIIFIPNLNSDYIHKLFILDETYEPTKRKVLKIMSPYVIVISGNKPNIEYPFEGPAPKPEKMVQVPIVNSLQRTIPNNQINAIQGTVNTHNPLNEIIKDPSKCINKLNYGNSSRLHIHANKYIGDNRVRRRISRNRQNAEYFYQLLHGTEIPYESKVERNTMNRNGMPLWNPIDGYMVSEVKFKNLLQKNPNPFVYQKRKRKRKQRNLKRKVRIRNTNNQIKTLDNILSKTSPQINEQVANTINRYCGASGKSSTDVNGKVYDQNNEKSALPTDYIYNSSFSSSNLQAKIRIFRKRRSTWWRITPTITLNKLSGGTYVNGNVSVLLTSHNEVLKKKIPKYIENGLQIINNVGFLPISSKVLTSYQNISNPIELNILDTRMPEFGVKIKMPFIENSAYHKNLKVTLSRIVTDCMTKDALQIFIEVINKGHESQEFSVGIANCPLSDFKSTKTTVKKILLPYISETITLLLPFIMASKKKIKFSCDVIVKASVQGHLIEMKVNDDTSVRSDALIAKRSMDIESHSRCFCIWNCRCHCIQKVETLNDINVCHRMSYTAERDAGLLLNCPPAIESEDFCPIDINNENCPSNPADLNRIFGIICLILLVIILLVIFSCKCFTPREEDLIVASTEWICQPALFASSQSNCDYPTRRRSSFITNEPCRKQSQVDLESALLTLTKHQKDLRNQPAKRNCVNF